MAMTARATLGLLLPSLLIAALPVWADELDALGHYERGLAAYNAGELDEAITALTKAVELSPQSAESHFVLRLRLPHP